ncbi:hypothetical protein HUU40_14600 [candidate division KSB1 bacterium]|nr:hypothetical protein [candidate division KSB1 bacterium]
MGEKLRSLFLFNKTQATITVSVKELLPLHVCSCVAASLFCFWVSFVVRQTVKNTRFELRERPRALPSRQLSRVSFGEAEELVEKLELLVVA